MTFVSRNLGPFVLVGLALALSSFFYSYFHHTDTCFGLLTNHADIACSIVNDASIKINRERLDYIRSINRKLKRMVDYDEIEHASFGPPTTYRNVGDTIGYGVVMGLVWKITQSFKFRDIQYLQMIIFSLLMFLIYGLAMMWFGNQVLAYIICCSFLSFTPLIIQNTLAQRDIWAFYGLIVLLYGVSSYFLRRTSLLHLGLFTTLFTLCQWVRPTVFFSLCFITFLFTLYALRGGADWARLAKGCLLLWAINLSIFWAPFMTYNKIAYDRYFVSPSGQMLLAGLGEFENDWGFKCSDAWIYEFIEERHGEKHGSPAFDDRAKEEFWRTVKHNPLFYVSNILRRIPHFFFPQFLWYIPVTFDSTASCTSLLDKIKVKCGNWLSSFERLGCLYALFYSKLFFFFGYLGLLFALLDKKYYFISLFYVGCLFSSFTILFSHIEGRYLIPYYGIFPFFVGYGIWRFGQTLVKRI